LVKAVKGNSVNVNVLKTFIYQCPMGTATLFLIFNSLGYFVVGGLF